MRYVAVLLVLLCGLGVTLEPADAQVPSFIGDVPAAGSVGLLVASGYLDPAAIAADLGAAGRNA